jgi:hypothetical protein
VTADQREQHDALTVQRHMRDIADLMPELQAGVRRGGGSTDGNSGGKRTKRPAAPSPVNEHTIDVIAEIDAWVHFLARVLIDETEWMPASDRTADILSDIATNRVGHFTEHADEGIREATADDAKRLAKLALNTARPSGRRKIRLGTPCLDYGTSDLGERIVCTGEYTTVLEPSETIGDLVCSKNPQHRMTPLEWQRAQRHDPTRDRDMDALLYGGRVRHRSERIGA